MRTNSNALYERIMTKLAPVVRKALNENVSNGQTCYAIVYNFSDGEASVGDIAYRSYDECLDALLRDEIQSGTFRNMQEAMNAWRREGRIVIDSGHVIEIATLTLV